MATLKERKSSRSFDPNKELPVETLSDLLWAASGVNREDSGRLTAPTACNWQEIDVYVAMKNGLFLYIPKTHSLSPVSSSDIRQYTGLQPFVKTAPIVLIYVADFEKMGKDTTAQNFYSATDTGFISQNVYLFCASEGLATVVLGYVDKTKLAKVMSLKPQQKIILTQPVGYPGK